MKSVHALKSYGQKAVYDEIPNEQVFVVLPLCWC